MNKDVIYIDVEDDITSIIGKVKASKEKIVALVPPKRIGVLQSAVNLHLLVRMAKNADKQLVLVTNNQSLIALSAAAAIPIAKNLQSRPELAEIPALAVDDEDDIIDGNQLPDGESEKTVDTPKSSIRKSKSVPVVSAKDDDEETVSPIVASSLGAAAVRKATPARSNIKVPNFGKFRKRLFLGIGGLIVLILFLIWANVFAPAATIVITAKAVASPISQTVALSGTTPTDVSKGTIQTVTQTLKKDVSVKFNATGQQDLGNKASGTMTVSRSGVSDSSTDIPSGTEFSSGDLNFFTTSDATVPASSIQGNRLNNGTVTVNVQAEKPGPTYNLSAQSYQSSISGFSAQGSNMAGGTTNVQTVVSASDITTATTALNALSTDSDKKTLLSQFKNGEYVINDTFNVTRATPVSSPALNAQASGQATLTSNVTYTIQGIARPDIEQYLKSALNQQINGATDQRIYDDGISNVVLAGYNASSSVPSINISATGKVGPNIDPNTVKSQSKGQKSGQIQAQLEAINGVSDVKVNFSFPWVTTVPNDNSKIDVQFKLTNG